MGGLLLLALLLDQVVRQRSVVGRLGPQVVDNPVEELLRELRVELLRGDRPVRQSLVRLLDGAGEPASASRPPRLPASAVSDPYQSSSLLKLLR
ncbi:MAG: hypothetical protein AVDCRST_MAG01-01-1624 [uncultured Rubrobacteraceae bacterium]|uniref:Uncharacterized protein n=1 Tax=uncultured Rubrobacteraceae bacterium TaxID=349277 RepID=A0A6J4PD17_9ACTN|nr:MAG: hypothetical protein AVDCRST_MAG01-01-1624 [uncultured Rubrobacteraceae bacterium]